MVQEEIEENIITFNCLICNSKFKYNIITYHIYIMNDILNGVLSLKDSWPESGPTPCLLCLDHWEWRTDCCFVGPLHTPFILSYHRFM